MSAAPSPTHAVEVPLRDGSVVLVRPVEPGDKALIRAGFERLSAESRYRRFLTPTSELTDAVLRYLTEVDHHDHEALIATDRASAEGVGIARYVRERESDVAEVAVTVVDDWQGRGLGTALLELLALRAREEGIARVSAVVLASNDDMIDMLRRIVSMRVAERDGTCIRFETDLPERGVNPGLRELLRRSADRRSPVGPGGSLVEGAPRDR